MVLSPSSTTLFLVTLPSLVLSCYITKCVTTLPGDQCFLNSKSSMTYQIQACASGEKCAIDQTSSTELYDFTQESYSCVPENWIKTKKFPGELCTNGGECVSRNCSSKGTCKGLGQGEVCQSHEECDVGLVCTGILSTFCTPQTASGGLCSHDYDCANDSLCFNSRCTGLLSLPNGSLIQSSNVLLCSSGYSVSSQCMPAPRNVKTPSDTCYSDKDCKTLFPDGKISNSRCLCGMNSQGLSFCQAVAGDSEFDPFKNGLLAIKSVNTRCHYSTSFSARCPELSQDVNFQQFITAYYIYIYRHSIVAASECVQSIMPFAKASTYLALTPDTSTGSADKTVIIVVVVVVFSVILMSGVVCFICVRRCAMAERYEDNMRRRIMHQGMEGIEIRIGRIVKPADSLSHFVAAFSVDDLNLDQKDKRFIKTGIPTAIEVNQRNLEQIEHPEELSEIRTSIALIPPIAAFKIDVVSLESSENASPSTLFKKSIPNSAQMRGE